MDTLIFAVNAVMPILLLIFFGYFLKRKNFLDEDWFKKGNKLIFKVCLPSLLFTNVYNIESFSDINWSVVIYSEIVIFAVFFATLAFVKIAIPDDRQKGVILQCSFRSNFAIIGLTLAEAIGGAEGVGIAAILSAFSIPTFNVLAVISLTMFVKGENGKKTDLREVLVKIAHNPLIIGVVLGLICLGIRSILPKGADGTALFTISGNLPFVYSAISNVAKIASPLALIVLGGLFDFSAVKGMKKQIILATSLRVLIVPGLAIGIAVLLSTYTSILSFDHTIYPSLIALFGSPVAVASAIMAQEMDNDGTLAGQLVVWTSVMSIFTLFLFIVVLRGLGLL